MEKKEKEKPKSYLVVTSGFKMQFNDIEKAKAEFDKIKDRKIKNEEVFTLALKEREDKEQGWEIVEECKIAASHYE